MTVQPCGGTGTGNLRGWEVGKRIHPRVGNNGMLGKMQLGEFLSESENLSEH